MRQQHMSFVLELKSRNSRTCLRSSLRSRSGECSLITPLKHFSLHAVQRIHASETSDLVRSLKAKSIPEPAMKNRWTASASGCLGLEFRLAGGGGTNHSHGYTRNRAFDIQGRSAAIPVASKRTVQARSTILNAPPTERKNSQHIFPGKPWKIPRHATCMKSHLTIDD